MVTKQTLPIPVLSGTQKLSLIDVFRALDIFGGVNNVRFYCLYVYQFDYREFLIVRRRLFLERDSLFLTRGYARAYHELLQRQGYANESLAHS